MFKPSELLNKLVAEGKLGKKSGKGVANVFGATLLPGVCVFQQLAPVSSISSIRDVAIIGTGTMGCGIAQTVAESRMNVMLVGRSEASLRRAVASINRFVKVIAKKELGLDKLAQDKLVDEVSKRITTTTSLQKAVAEADLVIEAVIERLDVKRELFQRIESASKSRTLLATNTSSLRLSEISVNLQRKRNFGGLHFFNPVRMMKLLEVVRCAETSPETLKAFLAFGKALGKEAIECTDKPGFIVNRILVSSICESLKILEAGDASMKQIDTAMRLGASHPMGPFQLISFIGVDTFKTILQSLHEAYPDDARFGCIELLNKMIDEGKFSAG
ncbi:unnamed protein product [Anisakis simplex]|uniref:Uncharacterized protein n=1 Tax=Anisakis simplex TaxID=6269 RepID=A0A3P6SN10_ANISI|nr:unnamed protein product [Anisakis simplex]